MVSARGRLRLPAWFFVGPLLFAVIGPACSDLQLGQAGHFSSSFEDGNDNAWSRSGEGFIGGAYGLDEGQVTFAETPVRSGPKAMLASLPEPMGRQQHAAVTRTRPYPAKWRETCMRRA